MGIPDQSKAVLLPVRCVTACTRCNNVERGPKGLKKEQPTWEFSCCKSQAAVVVISTAISGIMSLYEVQHQPHLKIWCARSIWPSHDRPAPTKVIASANATAAKSVQP